MVDEDRRFEATVDRIIEAGLDKDLIASVVSRLELRPVFTAHPTEAARPTTLNKLRTVADLLDDRLDPRATEADRVRIDRRVAEVIDQIWETDELRMDKPEPVDEARSAIFYFDRLESDVFPDLGEELALQLERLDPNRDRTQTPIRFGTWVGGDRDGNPSVTADVTRRVLELQHDHGLTAADRGGRAARRGSVDLRQDVECLRRVDGIPGARPRDAPSHLAAFPRTQRPRALPAKARLHPQPAGRHQNANPRGRPASARGRLCGAIRAGRRARVVALIAVRERRSAHRRGFGDAADQGGGHVRVPPRHDGCPRARRPDPRCRRSTPRQSRYRVCGPQLRGASRVAGQGARRGQTLGNRGCPPW